MTTIFIAWFGLSLIASIIAWATCVVAGRADRGGAG